MEAIFCFASAHVMRFPWQMRSSIAGISNIDNFAVNFHDEMKQLLPTLIINGRIALPIVWSARYSGHAQRVSRDATMKICRVGRSRSGFLAA